MSLILQCCLRVHMGLYTTPRRKYYEWSTCSTSCTTTIIELLVRLHHHGMEDTSCGSGHPTIAQPPQQGLEHMRCQFWSMTSECHIRHGRPRVRRGGMLEVGTSRNSSKIHHACSASDTSHPFFALSKGPSSKTTHKIKQWVQLHPFIKHYGSRWFWSGSQQGSIRSNAYISNLDVESELLLRLPWPPKNKLSLARYLIGFSCSTVDGTSSNIILKWWYTMTENEQDPPFPIKSKQCRGCPGIFPFLKGLLAKGTSFRRGALNPRQKKHLQSSTTWSFANAHAVVAISHGFNLEVQGQSCWRSLFTTPDERSVAMMRIPGIPHWLGPPGSVRSLSDSTWWTNAMWKSSQLLQLS